MDELKRVWWHYLVYLPALAFWVPFAVLYRIAGKLAQEPRYMGWNWFGIEVLDTAIHDWDDDQGGSET